MPDSISVAQLTAAKHNLLITCYCLVLLHRYSVYRLLFTRSFIGAKMFKLGRLKLLYAVGHKNGANFFVITLVNVGQC